MQQFSICEMFVVVGILAAFLALNLAAGSNSFEGALPIEYTRRGWPFPYQEEFYNAPQGVNVELNYTFDLPGTIRPIRVTCYKYLVYNIVFLSCLLALVHGAFFVPHKK